MPEVRSRCHAHAALNFSGTRSSATARAAEARSGETACSAPAGFRSAGPASTERSRPSASSTRGKPKPLSLKAGYKTAAANPTARAPEGRSRGRVRAALAATAGFAAADPDVAEPERAHT